MVNKPSKGQIGWAIVVVAMIAASLFFGVRYPIPDPPEGGPMVESRAAGNVDVSTALRVLNYIENRGTLEQAGVATFGANPLFEGATANDYETTLAVTDPTADRTITLPDKSGTVMLTNTPGAIVLGNNVITGTASISHGLTTPQTAFCTLGADSVANAATCSASISGSTVTIKTWKGDGSTAGSVGVLVHWMVGGQP